MGRGQPAQGARGALGPGRDAPPRAAARPPLRAGVPQAQEDPDLGHARGTGPASVGRAVRRHLDRAADDRGHPPGRGGRGVLELLLVPRRDRWGRRRPGAHRRSGARHVPRPRRPREVGDHRVRGCDRWRLWRRGQTLRWRHADLRRDPHAGGDRGCRAPRARDAVGRDHRGLRRDVGRPRTADRGPGGPGGRGDGDRGGGHRGADPPRRGVRHRDRRRGGVSDRAGRDERARQVLVVGAGPAGAATSYWLAEAGHDVLVVEKKRFPREKTCGDGLTPRAVRQLLDMGLGPRLEPHHRYEGLRALAHGITLELSWPEHPLYPSVGYVVRRRELDELVAARATEAGAELRQGTEAVEPILEGGRVTGAVLEDKATSRTYEVRADYVVMAEGANTTLGRKVGASRDRGYPMGMALRGYYPSPLHADPWIESCLDLRDRSGSSLPGYGWVFPLGDGTVNIGVGLLSTFKHYKDVNTSHLLDEYVATAPAHWGLREGTGIGRPTGGRLPMGGSVGPKAGAGWLLVGDSAGTVNPFNGEGIDYAYETGRMAAEVLDDALRSGSRLAIYQYPARLEAEFGLYFKVARTFARLIGRPALMRELTRVGMHSRSLMEWVLRIMANLLRPEELGPAEAAYKAAAALARLVPERAAS
ncbi:MAG: geranylgeranyl reductase family protein [Acidimicrobiia bacterium]|nr:geranylgeranyl reductase family protein [Acidimicrobiia bacterium]